MAVSADPRVLRAISHPARNRILAELSAGGPLRAADVAERTGMPANQASFHLRQLAKYGLVEHAPELARDRRDRVWRAVDEEGVNVDVKKLEAAPGGAAAGAVFRRQWAAILHGVVDAATAAEHHEGTTTAINNSALRLTKDEAGSFAEDFGDLIERWARRTRDAEQAGRRTYRIVGIVQPWDDGEPEGRA